MIKRGLYISVLSVLLLSSAACSSIGSSEKQAAKNQIQRVETMVVKKEAISTSFNLSGTLQPYEDVTVSFEFPGLILETMVNVGDPVSKDQVLARLDSSDYKLKLEQANTAILEAKAGIKNATAAISAADASIKSADAQIMAAQAGLSQVLKGAREQEKAQARARVEKARSVFSKAQADAERFKVLYEQGAVSKSEYEGAQVTLTNASKDLEDAREALSLIQEGATIEERQSASSSLQQAQSGKVSAIATKKQAEASRDHASAAFEQAVIAKKEAELALSKTSLKAPISGVILEKMTSAGQLAISGKAVYRIGQINKLKVLLPVPDHEIAQWRQGQKVHIDLYNEIREGTVNKIYPATNSNTGNINVEVIIPNSNYDWAPGQVVKASRQVTQSEGILIPLHAVISNGPETFVYKIVNKKAVKTIVEVGQLTNNRLEITKGLHVGDRIVTTGASLIYDGQIVEDRVND